MNLKLLWWIPMVALAVALFDLPYAYYVLLRIMICGVCIYLVHREAAVGRQVWAWALAGVAVLYNPIYLIHLDRELWSVVNIATVWLFAIHMWSAAKWAGDRSP